jgi:hypothetical protein
MRRHLTRIGKLSTRSLNWVWKNDTNLVLTCKWSYHYSLILAHISAERSGQSEPDRETWKKAHKLFVQAFKEPKTQTEVKKLAKILKKPASEKVETDIFDYDTGFLRGLGRMSLSEPSQLLNSYHS